MAQRLLVLAALVIAVGTIFGTQSATAGYWTDSGKVDGYGPSAVAHGVRCTKARSVVRRTWSKGQTSQNGKVRVQGFTCVIHPHAHRMVACRNGGSGFLVRCPSSPRTIGQKAIAMPSIASYLIAAQSTSTKLDIEFRYSPQ